MNSSSRAHCPAATRRIRRRGCGAPRTPVSRWRFLPNDYDRKDSSGFGTNFEGGRHVEVSARILAAGLWRLQLSSAEMRRCCIGGFDSKCGSCHRFGFESAEGATKWNCRRSKAYTDSCRFDRHMSSVSVVSALQAELQQAQSHVSDIRAELWSSKKKIRYLLRKLGEERALRHGREQDKIHAVIDDLKKELSRERKNRQMIEILNAKLMKQLVEAKLSAKQIMEDWKEDKRARELLEKDYVELTKGIGEDKAEVEALKREALKVCAELEEERNMLQIAEVWREERVQMKLVDAKLALEYKYSQMSNLIAVLETFLRSRSVCLDETELRKVELFRQAGKSINIQDMKEFAYVPSKSENIFLITEELRQGNVSCPNENARGSEIVIYGENQDSSFSIGRSDPYIKSISQGKRTPRLGIDCNENADQDFPNPERSEVGSVSAEQTMQKSYSAELWRSCQRNGKSDKFISEDSNGTISNGMITKSPQRRLPDRKNPHIARGMKGWIEWPRGFLKNSLKTKLMESRMENKKAPCFDVHR